MDVVVVLKGICYGAVVGAINALIGYLKNISNEKFELKKAITSIVIGAIIGMISTSEHIDLDYAKQLIAVYLFNNAIIALKKAVAK